MSTTGVRCTAFGETEYHAEHCRVVEEATDGD